jgi:hypothetical protein
MNKELNLLNSTLEFKPKHDDWKAEVTGKLLSELYDKGCNRTSLVEANFHSYNITIEIKVTAKEKLNEHNTKIN